MQTKHTIMNINRAATLQIKETHKPKLKNIVVPDFNEHRKNTVPGFDLS